MVVLIKVTFKALIRKIVAPMATKSNTKFMEFLDVGYHGNIKEAFSFNPKHRK